MNRLLIQLLKLKVVRNVLVAFLIALGSIAITWIVNWKAQQAPEPPEPTTAPTPAVTPKIDLVLTPTATTPVPAPKPVVHPALAYLEEGYVHMVIQANGIYDGKISEHMAANPGVGRSAVAILVEEGYSFMHYVNVLHGKPAFHSYEFTNICGCWTKLSPDKNRDAIYAEPLKVSGMYRKQLCQACTDLQAAMKSKSTNPDNAEQHE